MERYFKMHGGKMARWMLLEFLDAISMVYWAYFMKGLSDTAFGGRGLTGIRDLLLFGVGFLAFYVTVQLAGTWCEIRFVNSCEYSLKTDVYQRLMQKDIHSFQGDNSAKYISVLNNDVPVITENVFRRIPEIIGGTIMVAVAFAAMLHFNVWVALLELALCLLPMLPMSYFERRAKGAQKERQEALDRMNADIKDSFTGFEVIKSFGAEEKAEEKFRKRAGDVFSTDCAVCWEQGKAYSLSYALGYFSSVAQLVFSVYLIVRGEITMGVLMGAMQISNYVSNPSRDVIHRILQYKTARPVVERVLSILEGDGEEAGPSASEDQRQMAPLADAGDIQVSGLTFSYGKGREILHGLSLVFRRGKKYAIVGASGSGKSTLLRLLMGYYPDYSGEISYGGIPLDGIDRQSLYQQVSMIHQNVFLFDDSIRNNITMFRPCPEESVWQTVRDAGLDEVVRRAGGLDARIEEGGRNLSGGERQRIAIARAFVRGTQVMLVDEATASLDSLTASQIDDALLGREGLTLIAITHRTERKLLERYDEVIVLEQGLLLEHAPYEELSDLRKRLLSARE